MSQTFPFLIRTKEGEALSRRGLNEIERSALDVEAVKFQPFAERTFLNVFNS
jgi:hypothetical protein